MLSPGKHWTSWSAGPQTVSSFNSKQITVSSLWIIHDITKYFSSKRAIFPRSFKRLYQLQASSFLIDCRVFLKSSKCLRHWLWLSLDSDGNFFLLLLFSLGRWEKKKTWAHTRWWTSNQWQTKVGKHQLGDWIQFLGRHTKAKMIQW